jgi:putative tryptophan/tyrosine transport system substrate-binding protein
MVQHRTSRNCGLVPLQRIGDSSVELDFLPELVLTAVEGRPMKRRELIRWVCGAAVMWPFGARAQQQQPAPVIGLLSIASPAPFANLIAALREGLQKTGYVEGQNLDIEFRWAEGHFDKLAPLAADLVSRRVAVIVATGGPAPALAAKAATSTIPIVFNVGADPVKLGLVASFNRPGGNVTGVSFFVAELDAKRLGLLHELVPGAGRTAVLLNPKNPNAAPQLSDITKAAQTLGLQITVLHAATVDDLNTALANSPSADTGALLVGADAFFNSRRDQIVGLVARLGLPAIYEVREFAAAGGLISYGTSLVDAYRQVGIYTGRLLKGETPAELPVIQPTRFELVINMRTAEGLKLTVPPLLLAQADEVIE